MAASVPFRELKPIESNDWLLHMHYIRGEYDRCERLISRSDQNTVSDYSHYVKALIRLRVGSDVKNALQCLHQMDSTGDPVYIKAVIKCLVLMGRHSEVIDMMRDKALIACPNDWQVWHLIGLSFFHSGNMTLAKDAFQRSIQSSSQPDPYLMLCRCHLVEKDCKSAIFILRKACETCPDEMELSIKLSNLLHSSGMTTKSGEKMIQLQHVSTQILGNVALSLSVGSMLQEWRNDVDGALYRYKLGDTFESSGIWNNVAMCFASRNKIIGAISCLRRAHYLNPFDWRISFNLGILYAKMRLFASAFVFLKSAAAMSDGAPHVISFLAFCLESLGDDVNARHAHIAATKSAIDVMFPAPILNYAVFLCRIGRDQHRDEITDLMMEFEKLWVKRKQSDGDYDIQTMRLATKIATLMQIVTHMAWIRVESQPQQVLQQQPSPSPLQEPDASQSPAPNVSDVAKTDSQSIETPTPDSDLSE